MAAPGGRSKAICAQKCSDRANVASQSPLDIASQRNGAHTACCQGVASPLWPTRTARRSEGADANARNAPPRSDRLQRAGAESRCFSPDSPVTGGIQEHTDPHVCAHTSPRGAARRNANATASAVQVVAVDAAASSPSTARKKRRSSINAATSCISIIIATRAGLKLFNWLACCRLQSEVQPPRAAAII